MSNSPKAPNLCQRTHFCLQRETRTEQQNQSCSFHKVRRKNHQHQHQQHMPCSGSVKELHTQLLEEAKSAKATEGIFCFALNNFLKSHCQYRTQVPFLIKHPQALSPEKQTSLDIKKQPELVMCPGKQTSGFGAALKTDC